MSLTNLKNILILIFLGIVFFILGNNVLSLTNPDEVFYTLTAKEMIQHNTWLVPYIFNQPHFEKPILFFWFLKLGFQLFGTNSFTARFFPAFFAILGCIGTYLFCRLAYKDERKALFCSIILLSSALYIGLARVVMTDMAFSIFVTLSLFSFYIGYVSPKKTQGVMLFFFFSALAVLTKGLLGIILPLSVVFVFLAIQRNIKFLFSKPVLSGTVLFLALTLPWYIFMIRHYGMSFINEFFYNDHIRRIFEAEHPGNDKWHFYPLTIILGMFPWSIFTVLAIANLLKRLRKNGENTVYWFLTSWIICIFVICQNAHSKLVSYIFPSFPAIAIVTGAYLWEIIKKNKKKFFIISGLSLCPLLCASIAILLLSMGKINIPQGYYDYVPTKFLAVSFFLLTAALLSIAIIFAIKRKQKQSIYALVLQIPSILLLAFLLHNNYETYVSSKDASEFLLKQPGQINTVICSKMFARGIRYYTGKDIAAMGVKFFSPHPIPMLNSYEDILAFLSDKKAAYAVVRKSDFNKIQEATKTKFKVQEIHHLGDAYIAKIEAI